MTRLVLTRHGETVWHAENRYAGRSDVPLAPRGHEQARRLASWAGEAGLDGLWSSSLVRARETAAPAGEATGLPVEVDARLRELDFGCGEGLTAAEIEERFPDALQAFHADPVAHHLPGGEDPREAVARAQACLRDIAGRYPDGRVLVVMHSTLLRVLLCSLLGVPLGEYRRVFPVVRNCSLTTIRLNGSRAAVIEYNAPLPR
jgi:probable phosphoglycerate mutase